MIEFRTARADDDAALYELWGRVFPDAAHVAPLYAQDRDRTERTFLACDGDVPLAVVYWLPRQVRGQAGVHRVGCVSNVATLPEARGQGLVRRLLALAVESMTAHDCAWSLLFTGTPGVYTGWTAFDRAHVRGSFAPTRSGGHATEVDLGDWPVLAGIHARHNENRPLTTVRSPRDWTERVPLWYGPPHRILLVSKHNTPVAYAVLDGRDGDIVEIALADDDAAVPLFEAVAAHAQERNLPAGRLLAPADPVVHAALGSLFATWSIEREATGMARPVHIGHEEVRAIVEAPTAVHWTADYF